MVFFHHRNKQETLAKSQRFASTPFETPGNIYSNRSGQPMDDDEDDSLDMNTVLRHQEMRRYEELFDGNIISGPGDDDTLMDGSIYTSIQPSLARLPAVNRTISQEEGAPPPNTTPMILMPANLHNAREKPKAPVVSAAAKPRPEAKAFLPPVPPTSKKGKPKSSFKKLIMGSSSSCKAHAKSPSEVPSTPSTLPTPKTQASTPVVASPKPRFLSPARLFQSSKSSKPKQQQALAKKSSKRAPPSAVSKASKASKEKSDALNNNASSAAVLPPHCRMVPPPRPPSPPPPIDHCEIPYDAMSVGSAQSSLTDFLDFNTPPKIISGDHMQNCNSFHRFESYEVVISDEDNEKEGVNAERMKIEEKLTEKDVYFHNLVKDVSPLKHGGEDDTTVSVPSPVDNSTKNLTSKVLAEKNCDESPKENANSVDAKPGNAEVQQVHVLGLEDTASPEKEDVKRNLFGAEDGSAKKDEKSHLNSSVASCKKASSVASNAEEAEFVDDKTSLADLRSVSDEECRSNDSDSCLVTNFLGGSKVANADGPQPAEAQKPDTLESSNNAAAGLDEPQPEGAQEDGALEVSKDVAATECNEPQPEEQDPIILEVTKEVAAEVDGLQLEKVVPETGVTEDPILFSIEPDANESQNVQDSDLEEDPKVITAEEAESEKVAAPNNDEPEENQYNISLEDSPQTDTRRDESENKDAQDSVPLEKNVVAASGKKVSLEIPKQIVEKEADPKNKVDGHSLGEMQKVVLQEPEVQETTDEFVEDTKGDKKDVVSVTVEPVKATTGKKKNRPKSSKLKRFFKNLVHKPAIAGQHSKNKQNKDVKAQQWLEKELALAREVEAERKKSEATNNPRLTKEDEELEQQRETNYHNSSVSPSHTSSTDRSNSEHHTESVEPKAPRSFSILTSDTKTEESGDGADSHQSTTDITHSPSSRRSDTPESMSSTAARVELTMPNVAEVKEDSNEAKLVSSGSGSHLTDISCAFCMRPDRPRTHIVIPCMHYVLCDECVEVSRETSSRCHCLTCNRDGFLYARVGVLQGAELQEKLLQLNDSRVNDTGAKVDSSEAAPMMTQ